MANSPAKQDRRQFWADVIHPRLAPFEHLSIQKPSDALSDARIALQDELDAIYETIIGAVASRINALAPIACIPPEILAHVFSFVVPMEPLVNRGEEDTQSEYPPRERTLGWIKVTHVCRDWRHAALEHPSLWTDISFHLGARWAAEMLSRSKAAPIILDLYRPPLYPWTELALKHIGHTRTLIVSNSGQDPFPILACSAPILQRLEYSNAYDLPTSTAPPLLPPALFSENAPHLRYVSVRGSGNFPWGSSALKGLIQLEVHRSHYIPSVVYHYPRAEELINALRSMPNLEELTLRDCIPPSIASLNSGVVELPHLSVLDFCGSVTECVGILENLRIPPSTKLSVLSRSDDFTGEDHARLLPALAAHLSAAPEGTPPLRTFMLHTDDRDSIRVAASREAATDDSKFDFLPFNNSPDICVHLENCWEDGEFRNELFPFAQKIFDTWPLDNLESLSIYSAAPSWTPRFWVQVSQRFKRVKCIFAQDIAAVTLWGAVFSPTCRGRSMGIVQDDSALAFPSLESLALGGPLLVRLFTEGSLVMTAEGLCELLKERKATGAGLRRLALHRVRFWPWEVALLNQSVSLHGHRLKTDEGSITDAFLSD